MASSRSVDRTCITYQLPPAPVRVVLLLSERSGCGMWQPLCQRCAPAAACTSLVQDHDLLPGSRSTHWDRSCERSQQAPARQRRQTHTSSLPMHLASDGPPVRAAFGRPPHRPAVPASLWPHRVQAAPVAVPGASACYEREQSERACDGGPRVAAIPRLTWLSMLPVGGARSKGLRVYTRVRDSRISYTPGARGACVQSCTGVQRARAVVTTQ